MADRLMRADLLSDEAPCPEIDTTVAHIARVYDGLRLVDPGVALTHEWRPDSSAESATPGVL